MKRLKDLLSEQFFGKPEPDFFSKMIDDINTKDPEIKSFHDRLSHHYSKLHNQNLDDLNAIKKYTGTGSMHVNRYLHHLNKGTEHEWFNDPDNGVGKTIVPNLHPRLSEVLKRIPAPESFHVYTGLHSPFIGEKNPIGVVPIPGKRPIIKAHLPAYTSTSIHPHVAYSNAQRKRIDETNTHLIDARSLLKIHIPKGSTHGAYIAPHSRFPNEEKEFLINHGTKLHIHPIPEVHKESEIEPGHYLGHKTKGLTTQTHIYHAHIVGRKV